MRKRIFLNGGFSLVEVLVGVSLLTVAVYVTISAFQMLNKQGRSSRKNLSEQQILENMLLAAKGSLFSTTDEEGKRTQGLCRIMFKKSETRPPVGAIFLNLSLLPTVLDKNRWEEVLPQWTLSSGLGPCGGSSEGASFCFSQEKSFLKISVIPSNMNPTTDKLYTQIKSIQSVKEIDVKNVGFHFKTEFIKQNEQGNRVAKKMEAFEWAGMAGYCDYKDQNGEEYRLSPTGMETVAGAGAVFNRTSFDSNIDDPIEVVFRKIVAQSGTYDANGQYVTTDSSKNIVTSCREVSFRCHQRNSDTRKYEGLSVVGDLEYNVQNNVSSTSSMRTRFSYEVKKQGRIISSGQNFYFGFGIDCSSRGTLSPSCENKNSVEKSVTGSHLISVNIFDSGSQENGNQICRQICEKSSDYNTAGTGPNSRYVGYLKTYFPDHSKGQELAVSNHIGCTACYMKNCDSFGLGTFGPMNSMPYQPLDAVIPECSVYEPLNLRTNLFPYASFTKQSLPWRESSNLCMSAHLNHQEDGLVFSLENCSTTLPVMCFNFGQYLLARNIQNGGRSDLAKTSYPGAGKRCFEMGREITDTNQLNNYLGKSPTDLPTRGSNYEFINLATQGIFLAPQTREDITVFNQWRKKQGISTQTKFWIALNRDGLGSLSSRIPIIPDTINQNKHAIYFDGQKKLVHNIFSGGIQNQQKGVGILFHNIKFKGVKVSNKTSPLGKGLKFICRKKTEPYELFASTGESKNIDDGPEKCDDEGGFFLPPFTTLDWVSAMLLVENLSDNHPFPDPGNFSSTEAAWVAVDIEDTTGNRWKLLEHDQVKTDFEKTDKYEPKPTDPFVVLDGDGRYKTPFISLESSDLDETLNLPAKGELKFSIGSKKIKLDFNLSSGAGSISIKLAEFIKKVNSKTSDIVAIQNASENSGKYQIEFRAGAKVPVATFDIEDTVLAQKIGFSGGQQLRRRLSAICLKNSGKLEDIGIEDSCTGHKLTRSDVHKSELMKTFWSLRNKIAQEEYLFRGSL